MSRPPRRHETSRLEAFSDAVFGFALETQLAGEAIPVAPSPGF